MAAGGELRASREEVEAFVGKLREFHTSLDSNGRAMLGTILEGAQAGETAGYRWRWRSGEDQPEAWQELVGWIEGQGEEDTQGFAVKRY